MLENRDISDYQIITFVSKYICNYHKCIFRYILHCILNCRGSKIFLDNLNEEKFKRVSGRMKYWGKLLMENKRKTLILSLFAVLLSVSGLFTTLLFQPSLVKDVAKGLGITIFSLQNLIIFVVFFIFSSIILRYYK